MRLYFGKSDIRYIILKLLITLIIRLICNGFFFFNKLDNNFDNFT